MYVWLSDKGREFWQYLWAGARKGLSGRRLWMEIKSKFGKVYRLQQFYRDYKLAKKIVEYARKIAETPFTEPISPEYFIPAYSKADKPFCVVVQVRGVNSRTFEQIERHITLKFSAPPRPKDIYQAAETAFQTGTVKDESPPIIIEEVTPIRTYLAVQSPFFHPD